MLGPVTALRVICVGALAVALSACQPRQVDFSLRFANPATRDATTTIRVQVRNGSCSGTPLFTTVFPTSDPESALTPPKLEPGAYGFFAEARDDACQTLAQVCVVRELPLDDDALQLELADEDPPVAACPPDQCTRGECEGDAPDAGPPDEMDAGTDAGQVGCSRDEDCPGGSCPDMVCCFGCWDGSSCQSGQASAACGSGGGSCTSCGADQTCLEGGCVDGPPVSLSLSVSTSYFRSNGGLWSGGDNARSQRGNLEDTTPNVFAKQQTTVAFVDVAAGQFASCGIDAGGALYCWGTNSAGALGQADANFGRVEAAPVQVGSDSWLDVQAGNQHFCAIRSDAALLCWGQNTDGALGVSGGARLEPTEVTGGGSWSRVSPADRHTCGIQTNGTLYCWGDAEDGRLGIDSLCVDDMMGGFVCTDTSTPTQVGAASDWTDVGAGIFHTCGVRGGALYCWGTREFGRLGNGTSPTPQTTPILIDDSHTWLSVRAGEFHSCGIANGDEVFCFGLNSRGQIGSTQDATMMPIRITTGFDLVGVGWNHTCATNRTDTSLSSTRCWGEGMDGQLGNGSTSQAMTPVAPTFLPAP